MIPEVHLQDLGHAVVTWAMKSHPIDRPILSAINQPINERRES